MDDHTPLPDPTPTIRRTRRFVDLRRHALVLAGALIASGLVVAPGATAAPGAAADAPLLIEPARLDRGPESRLPRFDGPVLVHGERRIRTGLTGRWSVLAHDRALDQYLASRTGDARTVVRRVLPDGRSTVVTRTRRPTGQVRASEAGDRVALAFDADRRTRVRVVHGRTGAPLGSRAFAGHLTLRAADRRVFLSRADGAPTGTLRWHPVRDRVRRVSTHPAWRIDLPADRLAYFDADPYAGGCQVVVSLSRPRRTWWRSCVERVEAFSPTGRMVTVDLLSDGIGPREVSVRRPRGGLLARYRVAGWFGALAWEGPTSLVVHAVGRRHATYARCTVDDRGPACERAAELTPAPRL